MRATKQLKRIVGVDLFSGAGGMSLGAKWAGVDVRLAIEFEPNAARTYALNHPTTRVVRKDIRTVKSIRAGSQNDVRILFGGPPCQDFSTSNQRTRHSDSPGKRLFMEFVRLAAQWSPDLIVFENVKGMTETLGGRYLDQVEEQLIGLGYTTSTWILNAADYGVPQRRSRLFVVGSRKANSISEPAPLVPPSRYVTVSKAISDLPQLENGAAECERFYDRAARSLYAKRMRSGLRCCSNHLVSKNSELVVKRYPHIPPGGNWERIPVALMKNYKDSSRCHTGIYRRLCAKAPSIVIGNFRKNMLIHPVQHRGLSVREAARLQSFPDDYVFTGSIGFQQQQVANGVPPLLAQAVFAAVIQSTEQVSWGRNE